MKTVSLRSFNAADRSAFSGCESSNPIIAELGIYTVIVDGSMLTAIKTDLSDNVVERFGDHGCVEDAILAAQDLVDCYNTYGHKHMELYRLICCYAGNIR